MNASTLLAAWESTLQADPAAPAVIDAAQRKTYSRQDLEERAREWSGVHGKGLAGRTVILTGLNSFEWLGAFVGLLKANAVIVPLDPGEPPAVQQSLAKAIRAGWIWNGAELQTTRVGGNVARDGRRLIKLTSGSTGIPRRLAFTDLQLLADGWQVSGGMGIRPDDVNLGLIPLGHSYGLGNLVLPLLIQGTAVITGVAALPQVMAEAIGQWRPSVFPAVPALLRALAGSEIPPRTLESLRVVISAGAPLDPDVARGFYERFGKKVHNFYGSSETGGISYDVTGDAALSGRSVGTPLPGVRIVFETRGRFTVESAAVFTLGNRRRGTEGRGRHRPADLATLSSTGELVLQGRSGRVVKIAGRRLNLGELETTLKTIAGVHDALVVPHPSRPDALAAAVAYAGSAETLRVALRDRVASWKIPKRIEVLPAFPLTERGKVDTRRLRELLAS